jgi:hypothetical protein
MLDVIWLVVHCQTKLRYFAHYSTIIDAESLAEVFLSNYF